MFCKKGVLRNFTGKHLCRSLFFNKVAGLRPANLLKKRLWHRCFPVNFVKFLLTPILQNTSGRLLPCFGHAQKFYISHFTYHLRYYMIIDYCWSCQQLLLKLLITSYIRLCNHVTLNPNESIKVAHLQKLANQSVLNGALVIEKWLNNSFSESKKNFCRLIKLRTPKICISTRFRWISQLFRSAKEQQSWYQEEGSLF